ncbi:hypothetical protein LOAG_01891 [Loa loa]|uniref:Uncharacterized protein n=1 Tax=Loa loa TaxID=7209 RepID=A0A1S0U9T7_LOALO|nr:hypothetical protein LOAG_01891 [Loa loa]EFO26587.2 hypothetical protein LOAG_01891 [Loa loa]
MAEDNIHKWIAREGGRVEEKVRFIWGKEERTEKDTATKQKFENLGKYESPKKKTEALMQCKKSSADERVSERRKKVSTRQVKSCSVHGTTTVSVETVTVTRKAIPIDGLSFRWFNHFI